MMYQLAFAREAVDELLDMESPLDRRKLVASLQCLTADPTGAGISEAIDNGGRTNRIAVVGCHSFVFWIDHTLRRIRILAIRSMAD